MGREDEDLQASQGLVTLSKEEGEGRTLDPRGSSRQIDSITCIAQAPAEGRAAISSMLSRSVGEGASERRSRGIVTNSERAEDYIYQ